MLVATSASAIGLYSAMGNTAGPPDWDLANVAFLWLVLAGVSVGIWRSATPVQVMAQLGLACAAMLAFFEVYLTRFGHYWPPTIFAATFVLPLLIRRVFGSDPGCSPVKRRLVSAGAVLFNVAFNLAAFWALLMVHTMIAENSYIGSFFGSVSISSVPYQLTPIMSGTPGGPITIPLPPPVVTTIPGASSATIPPELPSSDGPGPSEPAGAVPATEVEKGTREEHR